MDEAYIGVDVGTSSARAGVFDAGGALLASAKRPIQIWREAGEVVEHSSSDIWRGVCAAVSEAVAASGLRPEAFKGIGFDATCSLVTLDPSGAPMSISPSGDPQRDTIVWMDHRAAREADAISATGHPVLRYVGGTVSPEMQTPKLAWLAAHMPKTFAAAGHFFDLTDFLTWRATGDARRSLCSVTCKFAYLAHEGRWPEDYFDAIGLGSLAKEGFRRIGSEIVAPGAALGRGLTAEAASAMGLPAGLPVGAGLIDAHAGAVGTIGAALPGETADPRRRLALILGTSACCMAVSSEPRFIKGVWGPHYSAMLPGQWLTEGGQSAFGAAIDHVMRMHPAFATFSAKAGAEAFETIERDLVARAGGLSRAAMLAPDLHVLPDFLGNRSPLADPHLRGAVMGLDLRDDYESLCELYVAGLTGLAHGVAQIIACLERGGYDFDMLVASGGAARSPLVRQVVADATGRTVGAPRTSEPVLLGAAMLGAVAAGRHTLPSAMGAMSSLAQTARPSRGAVADFHLRKGRAFAAMQRAEGAMRAAMRAPPWPRLVIFDCDGVLVDSEIIGIEEMRRAAAEVGIALTPEAANARFLGIAFETSLAAIESEIGGALPPAFAASLGERILARLDRELKAIPGIRETVQGLDAPVCVASSSAPDRIRRSLETASLGDLFGEHVFSSTMVAHGKPAPDLFLHAAQTMGASPRECAVVEDSVPGVKAAVAAGMRVYGFVGGSHLEGDDHARLLLEAGAEATFADMTRLRRLLAESAPDGSR